MEAAIKNACMRTTSSLILGPAQRRTSEGTVAHHQKGDAIRVAESAQMLSSCKIDSEFVIAEALDFEIYLPDNTLSLLFIISRMFLHPQKFINNAD